MAIWSGTKLAAGWWNNRSCVLGQKLLDVLVQLLHAAGNPIALVIAGLHSVQRVEMATVFVQSVLEALDLLLQGPRDGGINPAHPGDGYESCLVASGRLGIRVITAAAHRSAHARTFEGRPAKARDDELLEVAGRGDGAVVDYVAMLVRASGCLELVPNKTRTVRGGASSAPDQIGGGLVPRRSAIGRRPRQCHQKPRTHRSSSSPSFAPGGHRCQTGAGTFPRRN